jgi:molecular chaperone GrpE (heat shock protein)
MTQLTTGDVSPSPQKETKQGARELATQKLQLRKQQEKLLSDLLTVVDSLDRAADHWQQAEQKQSERATAHSKGKVAGKAWWRQWLPRFQKVAPTADSERLAEMVTSAHEGIEMIRESMLNVLAQHQVTPMPAIGTPFDPNQMHALGQQVDAVAEPNTVVQEVVRGYRWQDRTLRAAQVMVAVAKPSQGIAPPESR